MISGSHLDATAKAFDRACDPIVVGCNDHLGHQFGTHGTLIDMLDHGPAVDIGQGLAWESG
jgi:hypothetical protein